MAFKVALSGANYVSQDRKATFEAALQGGSRKGEAGGNGHPSSGQAAAPNSNGAQAHGVPANATPLAPRPATPAPAVPGRDLGHLLESLERGLARSYDHQSETLKVHQSYLSNEAAYASIFAQLMQGQSALFNGRELAPEQSQIVLRILESLSHSIEQFHDHQSETLTVHHQFLNQQAAYAESFVDLLRGHYGVALGQPGGGNGHNGHHGNGNGSSAENGYDGPAADGHTRQGVTAGALSRSASDEAMIAVAAVARPDLRRAEVTEATATTFTGTETAPPAETQAAVMAAPVADARDLSATLLSIVSDKTGYPAEMLELEMDMEADLGIDSIKRVEILGALQEAYPDLPDVDNDVLVELRTLAQIVSHMQTCPGEVVAQSAESAPPIEVTSTPQEGSLDATTLGTELLEIVSDKTGYPAEMLELEMDMEADLGIDSIKRVEILGELQDRHPDLPEVATEVLAELRTLGQILDAISAGVAPKKA